MTLRLDGHWTLPDGTEWGGWTIIHPGHPAHEASFVVRPGEDADARAAEVLKRFQA